MKKSFFVIATMLFLNACQVHTVRLGNPNIYHEPNSPEKVAVYYKTMPTCKYKEIALVDNPLNKGWLFGKWAWDLQSSVNQIKEVAAEQGADFVVIDSYHKNIFNNDKLVDAVVAYKCVK
ncbi:MAG: hypothetical protein IJZ59_02670 [Alphaproteobacteria bacterium]|nr:hypothetical protein [Alphaproteobacteria bacterium]